MRTIPKIKNSHQLIQEKQRLEQRRVELEKAIHYDWRDLKESLRPKNIAGQVFSGMMHEKEKAKVNGFMSDSISRLAARFTKKMVEKAEVKIDDWLKNKVYHSKIVKMEPKLFCQSCTMPIDDAANKGSEKDGSLSDEYCKYCYQQGTFTTKDMSIEKMKTIIEEQMKNRHIPEHIIQLSLNMLPQLKRWNKMNV